MRSTGYAGLAIVGVAAAVAVYALTQAPINNGQSLQQSDNAFAAYLAKQGKSYNTKEEYEMRREIFQKSLEEIAAQNS